MKLLTQLCLPVFLLVTSICQAQVYDVYVSDAGNFSSPPWRILKYDELGENAEVFTTQHLAWPQDILFVVDQGIVLISNLNSGRITKYNCDSGAYLGNFATGIAGPTRMKIGPDGLLYVLQWSGNGKVLRYMLDGTFVDEFTESGVAASIGIDWDQEGNLYVSSYDGDFVQKFDAQGKNAGVFINDNLVGPTNIWFDESGDMLVIDYDGTAVKRFDSKGTYKSEFITGVSQAEGVAVYPNGNILIGNGATSQVKLYSSSGDFLRNFVQAGSGGLLRPNAVVLRERLVSATQRPVEDPLAITPTIGSTFYLHSGDPDAVESFGTYAMDGTLVAKGNLHASLIWNAADVPEGLYTILLRQKDGGYVTGRVMVKEE